MEDEVYNIHLEMIHSMTLKTTDQYRYNSEREMDQLQEKLMEAVLGKELAKRVPLRFGTYMGSHWQDRVTFLYIASRDHFDKNSGDGYENHLELVDLTSSEDGGGQNAQ